MKVKEENLLYKIEHEEEGIWYFSNMNKVATFIGGVQRSTLDWYFLKQQPYKGWKISLVNDGDIPFKYINPTRLDTTKLN